MSTSLAALPSRAQPTMPDVAFPMRLAEPPAESPAQQVWRGSYSSTGRPLAVVATNEYAWERLWSLAGGSPPVAFDPRSQVAIGIFLGLRRTGGYWVEIASIQRSDLRLLVEYKEHVPGPGAIVTQALTSPHLILVLPAPGVPVVVRKQAPDAE